MNIIYQIAFVLMVTTCGSIIHASPAGWSRYPKPMSVDDMVDAYPYLLSDGQSGNPVMRKRSGPASEHFSRMNRRQELTNLYGKIVKEFPFLANQGLLRPDDRKVSIDDLLSMSVFGQPKMGKK